MLQGVAREKKSHEISFPSICFERAPVEPAHRMERRHHWWSSTASWKYMSTTVIVAVTTRRIQKTTRRAEKMVVPVLAGTG
jgi:hypothetical protein